MTSMLASIDVNTHSDGFHTQILQLVITGSIFSIAKWVVLSSVGLWVCLFVSTITP